MPAWPAAPPVAPLSMAEPPQQRLPELTQSRLAAGRWWTHTAGSIHGANARCAAIYTDHVRDALAPRTTIIAKRVYLFDPDQTLGRRLVWRIPGRRGRRNHASFAHYTGTSIGSYAWRHQIVDELIAPWRPLQ